jgi:prophage regulatory protein
MSAKIIQLNRLRLITKKELRELVPYTPQHIHRLEKAGRFPQRLQLGPNRVGWRLSDIEAWINARLPTGVPARPGSEMDDEIVF